MAYESAANGLLPMLLAGGYWSRIGDIPVLVQAVATLLPPLEPAAGYIIWGDLRQYPALLGLYAAGIGAVLHEHVAMVTALLLASRMNQSGISEPLIADLHQWFVPSEWFRGLAGLEKRRFPISDHLRDTLVPLRAHVGATEEAFDDAFDEWEVVLSLAHADYRKVRGGSHLAPIGRYAYRMRHAGNRNAAARLQSELKKSGGLWRYLSGGLFDGLPERAQEAFDTMHAQPEMRHQG